MLASFSPKAMHARKPALPPLVIALVVFVALFAAFPLTAAAQRAPGAIFTGMGFIDDHTVEDGTVVEAWIRGVPVAATKIFDQGFILHVVEPPGESFEGEVVRFKFRGLETDAAADWVEGTESWILLYAYTGLQGDGGNGTADPGPDDITAIRELRAMLLALENQRSELAAEFERQAGIEIATVTKRWEQAIEELRAEVELRIQQVKCKFELERQQITLGPRRDAIFKRLEAELDKFIKALWVEFEIESSLKQGYLDDEILKMAQAKNFELIKLNQLISQVETELNQRLEMAGLLLETTVDKVGDERPERTPVPAANAPLNEDKVDLSPKTSDSGEGERKRGFFTNSISTDTNPFNNALDPTALAVIGILITLAASMVQLVKGN